MDRPLAVITGASSGISLSGYVKTKIHEHMRITFEQYCQALGNPDFMTADHELATSNRRIFASASWLRGHAQRSKP